MTSIAAPLVVATSRASLALAKIFMWVMLCLNASNALLKSAISNL